MASRLVLYGVVSTLGAASVVGSALHTRENFFAAAVAVGRSSGALMVLANFALFNTICFGIVVKTIFFGQLRSIEYEHLFERLWLFLTESLLALTIFRDDFSAPFAVLYGILLFLKCFHWITADRVDYMDQIPPPGPPTIFHLRCSLIIGLLALADFALVIYSLETILLDGVSAMVLFASEFMILLASVGGTTARYIVGLIDLRRARGRADAPSWEEKSMYLFYVDLGVDFVKLLTYLTFFMVILLNYGLPLHILRDVYMTLRSFLSRCSDLVRYRRATKDMDALYPNATTEDLDRNGDRTCIICREEMVPQQAAGAAGAAPRATTVDGGPNETPKRLRCGHIFHFHCLRSWLERQQSCPTCRRDVLRAPVPPRPRPGPVNFNGAANGVNVQLNPPPPAPGAVPRAGLIPGTPNAIQAVYDQYFRPAQPAQPPQATPAPTTAGQPAPNQATSNPAGPSDPTTAANAGGVGVMRDQQLQRGIWGGPIAPGRFFATPLGAAPVWPTTSTVQPYDQRPALGVRSQGSNMPIIRLPEGIAGPSGTRPSPTFQPRNIMEAGGIDGAPAITSTSRQPLINRASDPGSSLPTPVSSVHTPFTSNPPQIFSPAGNSAASERELEQDEDDMDSSTTELHSDARRAAADAALRRFGSIGAAVPNTRSSSSPTIQSGSRSMPAAAESQVNGLAKQLDKGKGRASDVTPNMDTDSLRKMTPYLTRPGYEPLISHPMAFGNGGQASLGDTQLALEERLRVLREVDEMVWGLIGELTRVQSGWPVHGAADHQQGLPDREEDPL